MSLLRPARRAIASPYAFRCTSIRPSLSRYSTESTSPLSSGTSTDRPKVIFSGIQPTGVPHLGNYLGALQQWVKQQTDASPDDTLIYSVVDLHAITVPQDANQLRAWRREMMAALLAVGLDPQRSTIFYQSAVPAHSELMWILSCHASMGYLSRMTQWKSKLDLPDNASPFDSPDPKSSKPALKLGLFSYPVLQAADILVHNATHVPVGADQSQHLEFARECANSFNHLYGHTLTPPSTILSPAKRIMSLTHPTQKMSKSHPHPKSRILLTDPPATIRAKLRAAVTDSHPGPLTYDPAARPGVANLLDILFHMQQQQQQQQQGSSTTGCWSTLEECVADVRDLGLKALKDLVARAVEEGLRPVRERYEELTCTSDGARRLDEAAAEGAVKARRSAEAVMRQVREAVGM